MKKLFKNVRKVLSIFLLLCSTEMQPSEYVGAFLKKLVFFRRNNPGFSKELTDQFVNAVVDRRLEDALRMLNDPAIVSRIDVNVRNSHGYTSLLCACDRGDLGIIEKLLELKNPDGSLLVDINIRNPLGYTPLACAYRRGHTEIVEKLLGLKKSDGILLVDVNAGDKDGETLLIYACNRGDREIVEKLLGLKKSDGILLVDVNARLSDGGFTPLIYACNRGDREIVEKLLALEKPDGSLLVDVNARLSDGGFTALMVACFCGNRNIVKTLLVHGADATVLSNVVNLHTLLESLNKYKILSVFDALNPGIEDAKRTVLEKFVVLEYEQFLHGNHADLRNLLLVLPGAMQKRMNGDDAFINFIPGAMLNVFKKESITPLLYFLAEKQYQKNMADDFVSIMNEKDQTSLEFDFTNAAIRERSV